LNVQTLLVQMNPSAQKSFLPSHGPPFAAQCSLSHRAGFSVVLQRESISQSASVAHAVPEKHVAGPDEHRPSLHTRPVVQSSVFPSQRLPSAPQ
jgi:hypothetical protein